MRYGWRAPCGIYQFFPIKDELWEEITETGMAIRDDDIRPDELCEYASGRNASNRLFILSVAIHPDYQSNKQTVIALTDAWIDYLNKLQSEGNPITAIAGTAISEGGIKFLQSRHFAFIREIEDGNRVYVCEGDRLEKLMQGKLYFKSFRDDVYLLIPFAENSLNPKTGERLFKEFNKIFDNYSDDDDEEPDDETLPVDESDIRYLFSQLDACQQYECTNEAKDELKRFYCGEFRLMHTLDDYPDEEPALMGKIKSGGGEDMPEVSGEMNAYLSILSHRNSHMYVAMLIIPNCPCSTSQLEDQLFHECLKLRLSDNSIEDIRKTWGEVIDEKGHYIYRDLCEFLETEYGLLPCGSGKALTCMSAKPETEQEFLNILSGEAYFSLHQNFYINNEELRNVAKDNKAVYDYYEAYMSEKVVTFLFKDFSELTGLKDVENWGGKLHFRRRSELTATYVFIMELIMFQNTALNKMTMKVSNALAQDGDVSYDYITDLYRDYAQTVKFWQNDNFRYLGTQKEATQIREAFENDNLREANQHHQKFLEEMVDLQSAQDERRSGLVINFMAVFLAIVQIEDYIVSLFSKFYEKFHITVGISEANHTFTAILSGGVLLYLIIKYILNRSRKYERRYKIREYYRKQFDSLDNSKNK